MISLRKAWAAIGVHINKTEDVWRMITDEMPVISNGSSEAGESAQRFGDPTPVADFGFKVEKVKKAYFNLFSNPGSSEAAYDFELAFRDIMSAGSSSGFPEVSEYASMVLKVLLLIKNNKISFNSRILDLVTQAAKYLEIINIQVKRGKVILDHNNPAVAKLRAFELDIPHYLAEVERKKILIVDDDPDILRLVEVVLKRAGFNVSTAKNGMDAINYLQTDIPSLMLLDVAMPGMNGFDVLSRVKSDERTRAMPIMMLTARSQKEEIVKAIQMGALNYMAKPFDSKELISRIKKIIGE